MSIADFDGGGSAAGSHWNFSDSSKEGFSLKLEGDVVEIREVQKNNFVTKKPEFWPNGDPVLNLEVVIAMADDTEKAWNFSPGSSKNPSKSMEAIKKALEAAQMPAKSVKEIGGLNVSIATKQPAEGFKWGQGNPRPFGMRINSQGSHPYRGYKEFNTQAVQPVQQAQPAQQQAAAVSPVYDAGMADEDFEF